MATQMLGSSVQGSQVRLGNVGSIVKPCWRCIKHRVQCIVAAEGARCDNCQAKHYGCSLVLPKELGGGRGGVSGTQKVKAAEGSQTKGWARKARKVLTLGMFIVHSHRNIIIANLYCRTSKKRGGQVHSSCQCSWCAVHVVQSPSPEYRHLTCLAGHV